VGTCRTLVVVIVVALPAGATNSAAIAASIASVDGKGQGVGAAGSGHVAGGLSLPFVRRNAGQLLLNVRTGRNDNCSYGATSFLSHT
jgi:hypothetical protein